MEGTVLHFNEMDKKGILRTSSGERYEFTADNWKSETKPRPGLSVDFMEQDNIAVQIYVLKRAGASGALDGMATDFGSTLRALFLNGIYNKFGVIATFAVLVSGIFIEEHSKFLIVFLIILAIFFYAGVKKLYVKILSGFSLGIIFIGYLMIFSQSWRHLRFQFGIYSEADLIVVIFAFCINIISLVMLLIAAYMKKYKENEHI